MILFLEVMEMTISMETQGMIFLMEGLEKTTFPAAKEMMLSVVTMMM